MMNNFNTPKMVPYYPSLRGYLKDDLYSHMFTEDVHLGIMPIGIKSRDSEHFKAKLDGENKEKAKEILIKLGEFGNSYDLLEIASDAITNIARNLAFEGDVLYEIVNSNNEYNLYSFTSKRVIRFFTHYFQFIPKADWEYYKRKYSIIHKNNIWHLTIPKSLGGIHHFKIIKRKLSYSNHLAPTFYLDNIIKTDNIFDYKKYIKTQVIYYNNTTLKWGWNRRDWSQEYCTEYYTIYKNLVFKRAQSILRNYIIDEINKLFIRLDIDSVLYVDGIPKPYYIDNLIRNLNKGEISLAKASEDASIYK